MNPSQSQRLPSFRDFNDIQKVVLPFSKSKILSKKTYVPNLVVSRKTPSTQVKEEGSCTDSASIKDTPHQRRERKQHNVIQTEGIFSSGFDKPSPTSLGKFGNKSSSATGSGSIKNKQLKRVVEKLDGQRKSNAEHIPLKEGFERRPEEFEKHPVSAQDLPSALPWTRVKKSEALKSEKDTIKDTALLTDIIKPNDEIPPLFILKTPKYVPAVLDDSQNPKIHVKRNDTDTDGYKCTIHDLPEGQIGKLHVMKSGKLRLILGDCKFILQQGVKVNFKEELAVINVDPSKKIGEIVNLGDINNRIIIVPENITELITAT